MMGMEMMFKALGLDPEVIMKSAEEFKEGLAKLNADLEIIKAQQPEILMQMHQLFRVDTIPALTDAAITPVVSNGHG